MAYVPSAKRVHQLFRLLQARLQARQVDLMDLFPLLPRITRSFALLCIRLLLELGVLGYPYFVPEICIHADDA